MKAHRGPGLTLATIAGIAVLITTTAARQAPVSQPKPNLGGVFGRVVDHETGAPVRFAAVQVARVRVLGQALSTVASEDGTFMFTGLQPGSYVLAAVSPAHAPSYYSTEAPPVAEPGMPFPVRSGERTGPLEIRLARGGVITGTVTDLSGDPVTGVMVNIDRWPPVVNPGQSPFYFVPRFVHSDVNGVYRAFGLTGGQYVVSSSTWYAPVSNDPATGRPRNYVRVYFPDTVDPAAAVPVEVVSGRERTGVDLRLRISSLFKISGTVSVPSDANVDYVSVSFQHAERAIDDDLPLTSGRQWTQTRMPPGTYIVTAVAAEPYITGPPPTEGRIWWAAAAVTVMDQDVSGIALVLQSSTVVTGRIVIDGTDTVAASIARPWAVTLSPVPSTPQIIRYFRIVAGQVGASGQFAIRNVTPGRYTVRLVGAPTDTAVILSTTAAGRPLVNGELEITAESTIDDMVVRVRR
jgi:hypothetical protein